MNITQDPHSLLYAKAFLTQWPAPLEAYDLNHVPFFGTIGFTPTNLKTNSDLLRIGGFSPSGETNRLVNILQKLSKKDGSPLLMVSMQPSIAAMLSAFIVNYPSV